MEAATVSADSVSGAAASVNPLDLLQGVFKAVRTGLIVFDGEQRIVLWNNWVEQHSGLKAASVVGKPFAAVFPDMVNGRTHIAIGESLVNNFASLISQTLNKAPFPLYNTPADLATGTRMQQAVHVMPLDVPGAARHCLVQISDVSMAVARERKLREMAVELESQTFVDGLTGIANRRRFDLHLEDEFRRAKRSATPISLIMIDVDSFKPYNDNYGHQRGDDCLLRLATGLGSVLHRSRDLVARYGGEEFAVILPDTNADGALLVAEAMRIEVEAMALAHAYSNVAPHVTVSLGVATMVPEQLAKTGSLVHAADRALYQAKRSGRNCVVVAGERKLGGDGGVLEG
ncbi:sensor domain-containing diguanylate cyclase [Noviherbaspirillum galbum]|uniref:diguanylate cyclase n=1 Tax=Noviherbaspirillum galbum TaxID=2709383 RepID=A0A6B3SLN2_9BURK|nr:diguanylate cyclase [Noviherbaspirillum galbum]NEX61647.1 diguanylate cyclase [Noviherbaspirillum galbum]